MTIASKSHGKELLVTHIETWASMLYLALLFFSVGRQDFCAASHRQASEIRNFIATKSLMTDRKELEKVLRVLKQP